MQKKGWIAVALAVIVLLVSTIAPKKEVKMPEEAENWIKDLSVLQFDTIGEEVVKAGDTKARVAIIPIKGVIGSSGGEYRHQVILDEIELVKEDHTVEALILEMDTGGGQVYHSAEVRDRLVELKEAREIPIYVSMGSVTASGGYWIASMADQIYAASETITGSIGVYMGNLNFSQFLNEKGIYDEYYVSGPMKRANASTAPVTEEQRAYLQDHVDRIYERFVDLVEEGRHMDRDKVYTLADGRIFDGLQAKEVGLVDEIGYLADCIDDVQADYDLADSEVFRYIYEGGPFDNYFSFFSQMKARPQMQETMQWMPISLLGGFDYE